MGNQESIPNNSFIVKKVIKKDQIKQISSNKNKSNIQESSEKVFKQPVRQNKIQPVREYEEYKEPDRKYNQQPLISENTRKPVDYIDNKKYNSYDENQRIIEKECNNNALVQRNMFPDIYNKNNRVIDYPTNSNNELSVPKKNFDNIKFTPFNFNEEVNKYKEDIDNEKIAFENSEKERRRQFEKAHKEKENFLNNQIKTFETMYNPWEILGLDDNDYNINNIKKAYKKNALKYHPDKAGSKYQDKFQLITQSYIYLLKKSEETDSLNNKLNKKVEKANYEDDINEKVENIYINKDKFDINQFNTIFEKYKLPSSFDKGYSNMINEDIEMNNDDEVFGKKFNNDIFNAHFDNIKTKKKSNSIIEYQEPMALESSLGNLNHTMFGQDNIEDFGAVNSSGLSYTDYKKAHVDETLLIDVNKVKYKTYKSIDQLESDRSSISYTATPEDKKRYEYLERKREEEDNFRTQQQRNYDNMIESQYRKINQKLIIHK
jgi:hypothetical protein